MPKIAKIGPKIAKIGPKIAKIRPKIAKIGPKIAKIGPKICCPSASVAFFWREANRDVSTLFIALSGTMRMTGDLPLRLAATKVEVVLVICKSRPICKLLVCDPGLDRSK